jgi:hypothetical protein
VVFACTAPAQVWSNPDQKVEVSGLHFRTARSPEGTAPLAAALETIFQNSDVCCGKYSAMVDIVEASNPLSLQEVGAKLQGRHILGDGRPILISANYLAAKPTDGRIAAGTTLLPALRNHQPLLMEWNSHLYVVYGAVYTEFVSDDTNGPSYIDTIDKLLLFDPISGKEATFDRLADDWQKVQGLLTLTVGPSSS